jgi:hypothetical protein
MPLTPAEVDAQHLTVQAERDAAKTEEMKRKEMEAVLAPPPGETPPPVEQPPASPPEPKEEPVSPRLASLLKRERDFQTKSAKLKADRERREADLASKLEQLQ